MTADGVKIPPGPGGAIAAQLLRLARAELLAVFGHAADAAAVSWAEERAPFPRLKVMLRRTGVVRGPKSAPGRTLREQLRTALRLAAQDGRFSGPLLACEVEDTAIELWLQTACTELRADELTNVESAIERGVDGIEIRVGGRTFSRAPSIPLSGGFARVEKALGRLCRKAGLEGSAWQHPHVRVYRTTWLHIVEHGRACVTYRGLRPERLPEITPETAIGWVDQCTAYLLRSQRENGWFTYRYQVFTGESDDRDTNSVRMAGCTYALSRVASLGWAHHAASGLTDGVHRAIQALSSQQASTDAGVFIAEHRGNPSSWGKLGTTALLAAATGAPPFREHYRQPYEALLATLRSAQRPDGSLRCYLGRDREDGAAANYYPGEALLALAREAVYQHDPARLDPCRRAFHYYRSHFQEHPAPAFLLWQVETWHLAASLEPDRHWRDAYLDFVFEQVDWLLDYQVCQHPNHRWHGAFLFGREPGSASCVYTEAVIVGARAARMAGDRKRYGRYRAAAGSALRFCQQLLITAEQAPLLCDPARAVGGVTRNLSSFEVRNDNLQHFITMALAVLDDVSLLPGECFLT